MAFNDDLVLVVHASDPTRGIRFDLSNQPTGTTRVIQFPTARMVVGEALPRILCGDGRDGTVTITEDCALIRDMYYENLTIPNGVTLTQGQYRIFVSDTLTIESGGTLTSSGANGWENGIGGIRSAGAVGQVVGCSGGNGAVGDDGEGVASPDIPAVVLHAGGTGGGGGAGGVSEADTAGGPSCPRSPSSWVRFGGIAFDPITQVVNSIPCTKAPIFIAGGTGGRGGASGGGEDLSWQRGGTGGGGGAGGGVQIIFARHIVNNGTISNDGGSGAPGGYVF